MTEINPGQIKPGEVRNPKGRPVGSENKLTATAKYYAQKLFQEFEKMGIEKMAQSGELKDLLQLIKTCLPKDVNVSADVEGNINLNFGDVAKKKNE